MSELTPCSQCGTEIAVTAHFCPECGTRQPQAPVPLPLADTRRRFGGKRVVVYFLAVAVVVAVVFLVGVLYFIRHTTIVTATQNGGRMEAPFGTLSTTRNPDKLAHELGLEIFPGAVGLAGTKAELNHSIIVSIEFRSAAPPRRIINYYHVRYPDATVRTGGSDNLGYRLVQLNPRDTLTIVAEVVSGTTRITVSDIRH